MEDIFIKQETYKIIVFKKRCGEEKVLEEAAKMIEQSQKGKAPKRKLTKE